MQSFEAISYLHVWFIASILESKKHNTEHVLSHWPTIRGDIAVLRIFKHEYLIHTAAGLVSLNWIFSLYRVINLSDNYCLSLSPCFFNVLIQTAQAPSHTFVKMAAESDKICLSDKITSLYVVNMMWWLFFLEKETFFVTLIYSEVVQYCPDFSSPANVYAKCLKS